MNRFLSTLAAGALAVLAAVPAPSQAPPAATQLWTIGSDDCVGVDTDGEPWQECGFQAFDMNAEGSRILTIGSRGVIQLWDGGGRELKRIDWPDLPSGASGYPNGRAIVAGNVGVAIVHHNQLVVIDLADGRIIVQRGLGLMTVQELRLVGADRVFADIRDRQWDMGLREIDLATGELSDRHDIGLGRVGEGYWVTGGIPRGILHRPGAPDLMLERSCMPIDARYCTWRDIPGRFIHVFDIPAGRWISAEFERELDQFTMSWVVPAGDRLFAIVCGRSTPAYPPSSPCVLMDFPSRRELYRFESANLRAVGARDEQGRPEVRLALSFGAGRREDRRVAADGSVRTIDAQGRAALWVPGGGMIVPAQDGEESTLIDAAGRPVARLPFRAQSCGNGWPTWSGFCRISTDGRRWLVPSNTQVHGGGRDHRTGLTLYEVASGPL